MKLNEAMTTVVGVLFAGNVYFIKHSLDRLDSIESMVWGLKQEVAVLHATMDSRRVSFDADETPRQICSHSIAVRAIQ